MKRPEDGHDFTTVVIIHIKREHESVRQHSIIGWETVHNPQSFLRDY